MTASRTQICSICKDELRDPKVLPCIHSLCLECLQRRCGDAAERGDRISCPECQTQVEISRDGVAGLRKRTQRSESVPTDTCEVCDVKATVFCIECSQKLCDRCSLPHKKWGDGAHLVRPLDFLDEINPTLIERRFCKEHVNERLKLHCFTCDEDVCVMCLAQHANHKCEKIEKILEKFVSSVDDVSRVTTRVGDFRSSIEQVETQKKKLLENMNSLELEIVQENEERLERFEQSSRRQVQHLLQEVQSLKLSADKVIKSRTDKLELAVTEMNSFWTNSSELKSIDSLGKLQEAADEVLVRAKELLQTHVVPREYHVPSYKFIPVNIEDLNLVGHITNDSAGDEAFRISTDCYRVDGVTAIDDQLFLLLPLNANQIYVYTMSDYTLRSQLSVPDLRPDGCNDMTSCVVKKCLYVSDYIGRCVHKFDPTSGEICRWEVGLRGGPCGLSVTPQSNLIVTFRGSSVRPIELSGESGQFVREIALPSNTEWPTHGLQLTTGQFVFCHGWPNKGRQRVCVADKNELLCYGEECGYNVGHLNGPRHLAMGPADEDSPVIFVADQNNHRIVQLRVTSEAIEFVRYTSLGLSLPRRVYFHHATRRLHVAQWGEGDVPLAVIQL